MQVILCACLVWLFIFSLIGAVALLMEPIGTLGEILADKLYKIFNKNKF